MNKKGFTLVELLVVIAIIGILATVVFINLSSATGSATDARNKIGFAQILTVAQLKNSANGNYTNLCSDPEVLKILKQADSSYTYTSSSSNSNALTANSSTPEATGVGCNDSANSFVAWTALQGTGSASFWCVDKNGSGRYDLTLTTAGPSVAATHHNIGASGSCLVFRHNRSI